jgi:uncharacterized protein (DUF983 family)
MTENIKLINQGVKAKCPKCGYEWIYKGKSKIYVTCPQCQRRVKLNKID